MIRSDAIDETQSSRRTSHFATPVHEEDLEFIQAIEDFKKRTGSLFPSWTEVLGIAKRMGYRRVAEPADS